MAAMWGMYVCFFGFLSATCAQIADEFSQVPSEDTQVPMLIQVKKDTASPMVVNAKVAQQSPAASPADQKPTAATQPATPDSAPKPKVTVDKLDSVSALTSSKSTGAAFSQITDLADEFKELREDDNSHIRQLLFNIQLREQLRAKLSEADAQLASDNLRLAGKTAHIAPETASAAEPQAIVNSSVAALLLQAASGVRFRRDMNNEQIAAEALDRVKALVVDITALRARDDDEVQALSTNAKNRETLGTKIATRREQLSTDAGDLLVNLGKIRDLAQQGQGATTAATSQTPIVAALVQQPPQQDNMARALPAGRF